MAITDPADTAPAADLERFAHLEFCPVLDATGAPLGTLEQLYLDADTGAPAWAQVVGGYAHMRRMLVPLEGVAIPDVIQRDGLDARTTREAAEPLQVEVTRRAATEAPILDATDGLSAAEEATLRAHYGLPPRRSGRTDS